MSLNTSAQNHGSYKLERPVPADKGASWISRDPLMEQLVRSLLGPEEAEEVLRGFYTDALHSALLGRLANLRSENDFDAGRRRRTQLPTWRLKRVTDYVEENLDKQLPLAALAAAAGLSCMYFAAQFRLATGLRPHDYVVRRRIQRAKELLSTTGLPIVEIALGVGFQSQSHFTTVFKRNVGFTPQRWQKAETQRAEAASRPVSVCRGE